jgi:hypothetical protein
MAVAREAADARAIPAHHEPEAVVLDLMDPERAGWWPGHLRRRHGSMKPEGRRTVKLRLTVGNL